MQRSWVVSPAYRAVIETVKAARITNGLSQRELARRLGKHPSFVNKIELLERRLDVLEFVQIAYAIDAKPTKLLKDVLSALDDATIRIDVETPGRGSGRAASIE